MKYKTRSSARPVKITLDGDTKETALTLIANMIITPEQETAGKVSRIVEQGKYQILPEMLAATKGIEFESLVLRVIYNLADEHIPATRENILLRVQFDHEDADKRLNALMNYRTPAAAVTSHAFALGDWIEQQRLVLAAAEMQKRANIRMNGVIGAYTDMMNILNSVAPKDSSITEIRGAEFVDNHRAVMNERKERLKKGMKAGPTFPWAGLNKRITNLKKGDMCTIMAKSKHGKSTLGLLIAEHMAHRPEIKDDKKALDVYDVAFFHVETTADSLADRWFSRKCWIQTGALRNPEIFDIEKEPYKSKYEVVEAEWKHNQAHRGHITYIHCPGITPSEFSTRVAAHRAQSAGRGRELVVILDYYQEMDWTELGEYETPALNMLASKLKVLADTQSIYLIVFSQYDPDSNYKSKKGRGGGTIYLRSQVNIVVRREDAEDSLMVMENGVQKKDTVGVPMFWHETGQPHSEAWFVVSGANDDAGGPVPVKFMGAYFSCVDDLSITRKYNPKSKN